MFLKNALAYSSTNLISQVALFIQGFILRRILFPEVMGIWNFVSVVKNFVSPFTIGLLSGAVRELPILKGKGDEQAQEDCRSVSLTYSIAEVIFIALCLFIYAALRKSQISFDEYVALLLTVVLVVLGRLQEAYLTFFQGAQLYIPLSRVLLINSLILAVFLPVGALMKGLWGVFVAALAAEGIKVFWMTYAAGYFKIKPKIKWSLQIFKKLASYSIQLRIADYPITLFMMFDILWVTKFMDMRSLAIYVMARSFFLQSSEITVRFGTVFMTKTFEHYGRGEDKGKIASDMIKFIQIQLLIAVPLVCWAIFSMAPLLIRQVIPLYADGIYPLSILLLASFFDMRNNNLFTVWLAENRLKSYLKANMFSLLAMSMSVLTCWYIVKNRSLVGLSIAIVVGYLINFIYIMATIGREVLGDKKVLQVFAQVMSVTILTAMISFKFVYTEVLHMNLWQDIIFSLKRSLLMLLFTLPMVIWGMKISGAGILLLRGFQRTKDKML